MASWCRESTFLLPCVLLLVKWRHNWPVKLLLLIVSPSGLCGTPYRDQAKVRVPMVTQQGLRCQWVFSVIWEALSTP